MLLAGFFLAVLLYIVGSLMDHHERAKRDREWKERWKGYGVDKHGNHYRLDGK